MLPSDQVFLKAVELGCSPAWMRGIFGQAWHCMCEHNEHGMDQQCSMITFRSVGLTEPAQRDSSA